jgi:hypothetical protein
MVVKTITTYYELEKFQRGGPVVDADLADNMDIIDAAMEYNRVALIDLAANGAGYRFDGTDDDITIADDANLDFDTNDDFYIEMEIMPIDVTRTTDYLINKEAGGVGYGLYINQDDLYIRCDDNTVDASAIIGTAVFSNYVKAHIFVSFDRSGNATAYIDGEQVGTVDISGVVLTLANAGDLHIGNDSAGANEFAGEIYSWRAGNTTQTATEVRTLANGSPVPYIYVGASQTEKMPNTNDRTFAGASDWADVDLSAYDETTDLTITADTIAQYCTCPVASVPTTIGKRYKLTFDVANLVATWTIKSYNDAQTLGTVSADGTSQSIEWIAETTGGMRIVAVAATSSADFDNFSLQQIGCVLQHERDGVGSTQSTDKSGNYLNGVVTGATAINIPTDQGGVRVASGDLAAVNANSMAFTWQNPEAVAILVQRVIIDVTTQATAAAVMDVAVVASAADTAATIFDDLTLNSAAVYDHSLESGTGLGGVHKMDEKGGANDWITGKTLAQNGTDLVGKYYIEYIVV